MAERKLISFANPEVKEALDQQDNASALVEALVANHLGIDFSDHPAESERVEIVRNLGDATSTLPAAPTNPEAPASALDVLVEASVEPELEELAAEPEEVAPEAEPVELPAMEEDPFFATEATPEPQSSDFTDLAAPEPGTTAVGVSDEVTPVLTPAFVPEPKIIPVQDLDEPAEVVEDEEPELTVAADPYPTYTAGTRVCPQCGREVLLDSCLHCGYEFK